MARFVDASFNTDCYIRNVPGALQILDVGTLFATPDNKCAKIFVNFNYQVYFGPEVGNATNAFDTGSLAEDDAFTYVAKNGWRDISAETNIFDCVCGSCWDPPDPL